jgi:hypothetical protein
MDLARAWPRALALRARSANPRLLVSARRSIMECTNNPRPRSPWNKGKLVGQKAPFKPMEVWAIRARLQMENRGRELALFDLGIDSKLRACDLVKLRVSAVRYLGIEVDDALELAEQTFDQRPL